MTSQGTGTGGRGILTVRPLAARARHGLGPGRVRLNGMVCEGIPKVMLMDDNKPVSAPPQQDGLLYLSSIAGKRPARIACSPNHEVVQAPENRVTKDSTTALDVSLDLSTNRPCGCTREAK